MPFGPGSIAIGERETIHAPDRGGEGRSARKVVPRRALADWDPAGRGHDALDTVLAQRSGDAAAIADYLGTSARVEEAFVAFASAYADQNELDHAQLARVVEDGSIASAVGWA